MSSAVETRDKGVARFRTRLFTAMMIVVATLTALGFYLAQRKVTADAERNLQQIFQNELSSLHKFEELRHAALADRCNALAAKSRINAAIEDKHTGMKSGIWTNGHLHLPALPTASQTTLNKRVVDALANSDQDENYFRVDAGGAPQLLFYKRLNPGSLFPPAYEICVYPLSYSLEELRRLRWQVSGAGALLLLGGFIASHLIALRFSAPVKKLALDSEENRAKRRHAEAALASTAQELERSTRYSADASHQLKSPVTVLRVGLESLLEREGFKPAIYEELSVLLHQTHRLTGVIEDLLLLSRMDAGHLQFASTPVNLSQLVDEWVDDLGALPDSPDVKIEKEFPPALFVAGEKRYTSLVVQNLLENARKYNRPGGRIRVSACANGRGVVLTVGNTGCVIAPGENIFERFHHSSTPSAASGHGIGLKLAR